PHRLTTKRPWRMLHTLLCLILLIGVRSICEPRKVYNSWQLLTLTHRRCNGPGNSTKKIPLIHMLPPACPTYCERERLNFIQTLAMSYLWHQHATKKSFP